MKTKIITLFCASFLLLTVVDMLVPRTEANVYDKPEEEASVPAEAQAESEDKPE